MLVQAWYRKSRWLRLLAPLSWCFRRLAAKRRTAYKTGAKPSWRAPVPVVVVGNISVGGVGKTPLVLALAERFRQAGFRPGIVSRGYGGKAPQYPFIVTLESSPEQCGDEPLLLAQMSGCPVVVDANRVAAAQALLTQFDCDLLLSDDGLQHYALARDIEIAVVDGARGLGNGCCLPEGPLREPPQRLDEVDYLVVNGPGPFRHPQAVFMSVQPERLHHLPSGRTEEAASLAGRGPVHAVAGIGNPQRFFTTLVELGYQLIPHEFPDHYRFRPDDLCYPDAFPVIMTAKDAVKCRAIAHDRCWYLGIRAQLPDSFYQSILERLSALRASADA